MPLVVSVHSRFAQLRFGAAPTHPRTTLAIGFHIVNDSYIHYCRKGVRDM
jgi:hypothetical protein